MFNRSKYKPIMAAKYLSRKWMVCDSKSSLPLLDLYNQYLGWLVDNATGCDLEIAPFTKKIKEVFPDATVKDGVVAGITPKVRKALPPIPPKPQIERDIERLLTIAFHLHPGIEYHGFTIKQVLSELRPDESQITGGELSDYLTNADLYFQHPTKGYWLKEWRG